MAETEDLKSFQYRFESDRGHQFVRKALYEWSYRSITQLMYAYTMPEGFEGEGLVIEFCFCQTLNAQAILGKKRFSDEINLSWPGPCTYSDEF